MKKRKIYLILIPVVCMATYSTKYFVFKKDLERKPMSYVYTQPIKKVRNKVIMLFSNGPYSDLDISQGYNSSESALLKVSQAANQNHFFINWFGWYPFGFSEKYYNWWGNLKYIPCYHVILDSISIDRTKIIIKSFPKVVAGTDFSLNHGLPYTTSRKVEVNPSTVEEYQLIKQIGISLGEKMPK